MATGLMKLPENRVRRNYTGGAGIDRGPYLGRGTVGVVKIKL